MDTQSVAGTKFRLGIHESLHAYVKGRMFLSPSELTGMFEACPLRTGRAYLIFTKSGGDLPYDEINPRQSFVWCADTRTIERFDNLNSLYKSLGIEPDHEGAPRSTRKLRSAVMAGASDLEFTGYSEYPAPVYVLVSKSANDREALDAFFLILMPYLESYRKTTLHCLNDTYRTRDDELQGFVEQMSPSVVQTAISLLEFFASHPRFGINGFALLKYTHEHKWISLYSKGPGKETALRALQHFGDHEGALKNHEDFDVLRSLKMLGISANDVRLVLIPFVRVHPEPFKQIPTPDRFEIDPSRRVGQAKLAVGDLVVAMSYKESPPQAAIHSIVYYRNYYFDVYLPTLLTRAHREIVDRTRGIRDQLGHQDRRETESNPWKPFHSLCAAVLPTICGAFNLSVLVSIYEVGKHALLPQFHWSQPGEEAHLYSQEIAAVSLKKGARGPAASVFSAPQDSTTETHVQTTDGGSQFLVRLMYRSVAIGMVTFSSPEVRGFTTQIEKRLKDYVYSLEDFLREFIAAHDSTWLSITAAAYNNLHELRHDCEFWTHEGYKHAVVTAIEAFDQVFEGESASLGDLQQYFDRTLAEKLDLFPLSVRDRMRKAARKRFVFVLCDTEETANLQVSRTKFELTKQIFKNMFSDFDIGGEEEWPETFSITVQKKPSQSLRFRQVQNRMFPVSHFHELGFQPFKDGQRLHHGLFLSSAVARFLGGFAWISNAQESSSGTRSVIELVIPLGDHG